MKNQRGGPLKIQYGAELQRRLKNDETIALIIEAQSAIASTKLLTIKDDAGELLYTEMLLQAKRYIKELDARETFFLEPIKQETQAIKSFFDQMRRPFGKVIEKLETHIIKYARKKAARLTRQQKKLERELARQQKKLDEQGLNIPVPDLKAPTPNLKIKTELGTLYQKKKFAIEVTDLGELVRAVTTNDLPARVLKIKPLGTFVMKLAHWIVDNDLDPGGFEPDLKELEKIAKEGRLNIPGCKIHQEIGIQTRL